MDTLKKSTLTTSRGFEYTYYTSPAKNGRDTVLLCHGWPDTAELWENFITKYLVPAGFGVVAPDCLGFGGTSKPTNVEAYNVKLMTQDVKEILDKEGLDKVISLGHDWGSALSQGMWLFYPERVKGVVMLNVAYMVPSKEPFNLDNVIKMTTQVYGYGTYWYWKFFTADDASEACLANLDSCFDMAHGKPETWLETLCKPDGARDFITQGKRQPVEPYATEEVREKFKARMMKDKFDGPQNWYRAMAFGIDDEPFQSLSAERLPITVPTLFWGGEKDMVCRPENMGVAINAGLVPDLKFMTVDAGHWALLAMPEKFGEDVLGWLEEKFPA